MTIMQGEPNAKFRTSWGLVWLPPDGKYPAHTDAQVQELRGLGLADTSEYRAVLTPATDEVQAVADADAGTEDTAEMEVLRRIGNPPRRGRPPRRG